MEEDFKPVNWLSALHRAQPKSRRHFSDTAAVRNAPGAIEAAEKNVEIEPKTPMGTEKSRLDTLPQITAGFCQRAIDEARKDYPDALYDELLEIAARQVGISKRRLRKHVTNPFR